MRLSSSRTTYDKGARDATHLEPLVFYLFYFVSTPLPHSHHHGNVSTLPTTIIKDDVQQMEARDACTSRPHAGTSSCKINHHHPHDLLRYFTPAIYCVRMMFSLPPFLVFL